MAENERDFFSNMEPLLEENRPARGSMTTRRELNDANMRIAQRKALSTNLKVLIFDSIIVIFYSGLWILQQQTGTLPNDECPGEFVKWSAYCAWIVFGSDWIFRFALQVKYCSRPVYEGNALETIDNCNALFMLLSMLLQTIWFIWSQAVVWDGFTEGCLENNGAQIGYMVFYTMLLVVAGLSTFIVCTTLLVIICCLPCICQAIRESRRDARQEQQNMTNVIQNLTKLRYDPQKFNETNECAICMVQFTEDCMVTPLPCDVRHYYHTECIENWMREKTECPMCRTQIDAQKLGKYAKEIDEILAAKMSEAHLQGNAGAGGTMATPGSYGMNNNKNGRYDSQNSQDSWKDV